MTRLLVIDAFPIWREGIKAVLSGDRDIEFLLEFPDAGNVQEKVMNHGADLAVLDVEVPMGDGFEILNLLRRLDDSLPILVFTRFPENLYGVRALKEGAAGYLTKAATSQELVKAVDMIRAGRKYISDGLSQRLASYVQGGKNLLPHDRLSSREFEVMLLLAEGMTPKEVSDKLSLSYTTVTAHKIHILSKMGLRSLSELTKYVITEKLTN